MRDNKPDDASDRPWFNWPLAVGLLINVLIWVAVAAWFLRGRG